MLAFSTIRRQQGRQTHDSRQAPMSEVSKVFAFSELFKTGCRRTTECFALHDDAI